MIKTLSAGKIEVVGQVERLLQEVGSTGRFLLRHHFHKGATVIRGMPVSHWDIVIDLGESPLLELSAMEQNPLWDPDKAVYCTRKTYSDYTPQGKPNREWVDFEGSIPPKGVHLTKVELGKQISKGIYEYTERGKLKTSNPKFPCQYAFKKGEEVWADSRRNLYNSDRSIGNPTKILPAYMLAEDRGRIRILEDNPLFMSMQFFGKKLKGYYALKREGPDSPIWVLQKSSLPGQKRKGEQDADEGGQQV